MEKLLPNDSILLLSQGEFAELIRRAVQDALADSEPEWHTAHQAAKKLGVTPRTIRNWGRQGKIESEKIGGRRFYKTGGRVLFRRADVEEFLEKRRVGRG